MISILKKISRIHYRLFGSTHLRPYEALCINAWKESLSEESKQIFDEQLKQPHFVQRQAGDAKVCFFWFKEPLASTFKLSGADLHVATVFLKSKSNSGDILKAKVFIHRGCFFSIEFPKRPKRYAALHSMDLDALHVTNIETLMPL